MADMYFDVDAAITECPVNLLALIDDTDFKTRETAIAYNAAGMDLVWNFVTSAGAFTQTAVTPTTAGNYDWTHQGDGMYTIEIPASGGASINNDTEGYGWFTGLVTGVLPWRGPVIGFRSAALNDSLCDTNTTGLLAPTVAARTLDVSAGGEAGVDWANVGSPTTAVNLSATNIDVDQVVASVSGAVGSVTGAVGSVTGAVGSVTGNVGGNVVGSVASVTAGVTLAANAITAAATAADFTTEIQSGLATAAALATAQTDLDNIDAKTTNLPTDPADQSLIIAATNAIVALLGTPAGVSVSADIAAVKAETASILTDTAEIGAAGAGLTALATQSSVNDLPTNAELATALDALPTAAENATAVLTTAMTESYRADGATGTLAQMQYEIIGHLGESAIVGTTKTINKVDGTTAAATFTLDSDTAPTSITRAT